MNEADVLKEFEIEGLSEAYLSGADLFEANLSGVDFSRADLSDCDLCGANLSGADLSEVNLSNSNLVNANLAKANLDGANLNGANLDGADLNGANLNGANLDGADLSLIRPSGANFSGANLSGAELSGVDLSGVNLLGVMGLASMKEEMEMLVLLREAIKQESFEFDMGDWHGDEYPERSSFADFLNTCGTTHCGAGYCQVKLAREGNPVALISAAVAGSYAIPSMARLFYSPKDEFTAYLDKLISGECPLLQR